MTLKLLVLHSELGVLRGGGENFTRGLFTALAERGHHISAAFVADTRGRYPLSLPSAIHPFPVAGWWSRDLGQATLAGFGHYIPCDGWVRKTWDRGRDAIAWRTYAWHRGRFQRRIESEFAGRWGEFDAVYVHGNPTLASKVAGHRPTIVRLPGPVPPECEPELRAAHAVCANGDALEQVRTFLGDQVVELPVGVDAQLFTPGTSTARSRLNWKETDFVIGYVGRLTRLKGVDLLAVAFRDIARSAAHLRLLVIGNGEEHSQLRDLLKEELACGQAHIEPGVNHETLPAWFRAMDLLVMPSRYENYSNALIEGMACGIPFLASDVGGNRQMSETGAGWLFQSGSISSLAQRLQRIVGEQPELRRRGETGLRFVRNHHTWAASAKRLEAIIFSCLGALR